MFVHNSEHNSPLNSDHDDDIHDSVTRIKGKNKIGFIDASCKKSNTYEVLGKQWDRYDAMIGVAMWVCNVMKFKKHNQLLKLMQFLMGLDDFYMQIRSSILSRETLHDVRSAYATISSEESHKVVVGSIAGSSQRNQASAFVSDVPNSQILPSGGSGLVCENYGFNGHTKCFKIIGYPADFEKKKSGQNFKKQGVSNNNYVGKSSSYSFSDEQMATFLSLIKDNKIEKNMQANMIVDSEANQHMTYTDKGLNNVVDISHLKIKVGHPDGAEAFISKIGNLKLSNGLILYDVMVILEYCDLNLKNVLETGDQCEGLYYYNNQAFLDRVSSQSVGSSNTDVIDLALLVFSLPDPSKAENRHLLQCCLMMTLEGFPFVIVNTKEYHYECSGRITGNA
ncbi:hypothetical protein Tco_1317685 [Tanacetum coccineum]